MGSVLLQLRDRKEIPDSVFFSVFIRINHKIYNIRTKSSQRYLELERLEVRFLSRVVEPKGNTCCFLLVLCSIYLSILAFYKKDRNLAAACITRVVMIIAFTVAGGCPN